jgi:hypothetical protein
MVVSTSLKILYSSSTGSTSALFILTSFFYSSPIVCDLPLACPVFHNIAKFVLGWYSAYEREHVAFVLLMAHLRSFSSSIHLSANDKISFFFMAE